MAGRIMEKEDLGGKFVIAVEDFSGVWNSIKKFVKAKTSLDNITLRNKFGKPIQVTGLKFSYELSTDPSLSRLKPHAQNPVAWFRNPYAYVLVVSCDDIADYRSDVRPQLRAFMEREKDPMQTVLGTTEWVVLYVRPLKLDSQARGPKRVFEKLQDDFGSKKKDRFVRLDIPAASLGLDPSNVHCEGLRELEVILKTGVSASFEAKQAAYDEEVRRLMSVRMEPGWRFPTLFLVKDSLALMLDAAGLLDDALREYYELEACYLEALDTGGVVMVGEFGGSGPGDDVASLLNSSWKDTRRAILNYGSVTQFKFRQFLFARQARLLLLLGRPMELADRALGFVQNFSGLLGESLESGHLPESLREVWVFSACVAVAGVSHEAVAAASQKRAGGDVQKRVQQAQGASPPPGATSKRNPQLTVQVDGLQDNDAEGGSGPAFAEEWKLGLDLPEGAWRPEAAAEEGLRNPGPLPPGHKEFFSTLGHLLSSARQQLLKLGEAVGLEVCLRQSAFGGSSVASGYPSSQQNRGPPSSRAPQQGPSRQVAGSAPASPQNKGTPQRQRPEPQQQQQQQPPLRSESLPLSAVRAAQAAAAAPPTPSTPGLLGLKARLPWSSNPDPPPSKSNGSSSNPRLNLTEKFDSESAGSSESSLSSVSASAVVAPLGENRSKASPVPLGANAAAVVAAAAAAEQTAQGAAKEKGPEEKQEGATGTEQEVAVRHDGKMPWLSEWRLKKALRDRDLFEDLFKQLSIAAAHCYRVSGRHRNATIIEADVAALLLDSTRPQAASVLFQRHVKMLEAEGWHAVLAQVLPEVVSSQELLRNSAAGHWKAKILSLPQALLPHVDRSDLQLSLEAVCSEAAGTSAQPHGTPRSPLFPKGSISGLDCAGALLVCPSSGPPQGPSCVGDVVVLEVELWSALPKPIALDDVVLTMVIRADGPSGHDGEFRCSLLPGRGPGHTDSGAEAAPGRNVLRFSAQPVQAGRYCLKHLTARVGRSSVHVPMATSAPASVASWEPSSGGTGGAALAKHEMLRMPRLAVTARGAFCGASGDLLSVQGSSTAGRVQDGEVIAEQPLFFVKDSQSRLGVSAPALPGSLLAGQTQWLGVRLEPRRDTLQDASVQIWTRHQHNAESGTSATTTLTGSSSQALVVPLMLLKEKPGKQQQQQEEAAVEGGAAGIPEPLWVRVEDGCLVLPEWAGGRPAVVWLRADVGPISDAPQVVRMSSGIEGPSRFDASRRLVSPSPLPNPSTSGDPASIARQISARTAAALHTAAAIEAEEPECDAHTEVEVDVRYRSGCNRSHNCILRLPVSNPCRVDFTAHRLDGGRIALEVSLTSCLPQPLTVRGCRLKPQVGLVLERDLVAACGAVPATVLPRASISFMYFVRQTRVSGGPNEGDVAAAATCFEVDYEVVATDKVPEGSEEGSSSLVAAPPSLRDLAGLEAPPGSWVIPPGSRDGGAEAQGGGVELVTMQRCFTIDMGIKEATPDMVIEVQALGPFTAVQGTAVHFCWRLLRGGAQRQHPTALEKQHEQQQQRSLAKKAEGASEGEGPEGRASEDSEEDCGDEVIEYEIAAAGDMWRAGAPRRRGRIWLTRRPGAAATIEASWVPLLQGTLPLPELQLRGVAWREARADEDNGGGGGGGAAAGALSEGLEALEDGAGGASVCNTPTHCVVHPAAATGTAASGTSGIAAVPNSGFPRAHNPPWGLLAAPLVTSSLATEAAGEGLSRSKSLGPPARQGSKSGLQQPPPALS